MQTLNTPYAALKALRAEKGLLQKDLADILGVSLSYIKQLESGQKELSNKKLHEIAEALGLVLEVETVYKIRKP